MMNLADYIALLFLVLCIALGAKRGFVRSSFSLGTLIISLVLALTLYPVVSNCMEKSALGDYVRQNVYKVFDAEKEEPKTTEEAGKKLNLPASFAKSISDSANKAVNTVKMSVAESAANLALKLLGLILVFLLTKILLWLIQKLLNLISRLPVLKTANKLLGGVVGAVYGILFVYLLLALLTFTTTLKSFNKTTELIVASKYVSEMYHENFVLGFIE